MKHFKVTYVEDYPLALIDPGDRYREEYGDLGALAESFDIAGIMNPLSLRAISNPPFETKLIAGGRRFFAMVTSGVKSCPVRIYEDISEEDVRLLERIENTQRKDFTWKEIALLDAEIHRLQCERHGAAAAKTAPGEEAWNQDKTAAFLGKAASCVSDSIKLAKALETHPEIAQCESAAQAKNFLRSVERAENAKRIVEAMKKKETSSSRATVLGPNYLIGDALEGLAGVTDGVADLIEIDPPYGIDYASRQTSKSNTAHYTDVPENEYDIFMRKLLTRCYCVAKPNAWLLLWFDIAKYSLCVELLRECGWKVAKMPLMWNKILPGGLSNPKLSLCATYECCLYAYKGVPTVIATGHSDVYSFASVRDQYRIHPTERPLALMVELFKTFALPGAQIISPFLGSGVSIYAAHVAAMNCFGWDLEESNKAKFIIKAENWENFNRKQLEESPDAE